MDAMYRKKSREAEGKTGRKEKETHVADQYSPKIRPRETHPDSVDTEKRISKNLNQLNRRLVDHPAAKSGRKKEEILSTEDRGAKVITMAAKVKAPVPAAIIISCAIIAIVFMYMLSLSIQIEEYSYAIDQLSSEIAELKEESTKLEVQTRRQINTHTERSTR